MSQPPWLPQGVRSGGVCWQGWGPAAGADARFHLSKPFLWDRKTPAIMGSGGAFWVFLGQPPAINSTSPGTCGIGGAQEMTVSFSPWGGGGNCQGRQCDIVGRTEASVQEDPNANAWFFV